MDYDKTKGFSPIKEEPGEWLSSKNGDTDSYKLIKEDQYENLLKSKELNMNMNEKLFDSCKESILQETDKYQNATILNISSTVSNIESSREVKTPKKKRFIDIKKSMGVGFLKKKRYNNISDIMVKNAGAKTRNKSCSSSKVSTQTSRALVKNSSVNNLVAEPLDKENLLDEAHPRSKSKGSGQTKGLQEVKLFKFPKQRKKFSIKLSGSRDNLIQSNAPKKPNSSREAIGRAAPPASKPQLKLGNTPEELKQSKIFESQEKDMAIQEEISVLKAKQVVCMETLVEELQYFNYLDCKHYLMHFEVFKSCVKLGIDIFKLISQRKLVILLTKENLSQEQYQKTWFQI